MHTFKIAPVSVETFIYASNTVHKNKTGSTKQTSHNHHPIGFEGVEKTRKEELRRAIQKTKQKKLRTLKPWQERGSKKKKKKQAWEHKIKTLKKIKT